MVTSGLQLGTAMFEQVYALFAVPAPALPSALCRMVLGGVLLVDGVQRLRDFAASQSGMAFITARELIQAAKVPTVFQPLLRVGNRISLLLHVVLALAFTLGIFTKPVCVLLCCSLLLVQLQNPFVLYAGDSLARLVLLSLLFAPCDLSLSYDAWARHGDLGLDAVAPPWGTRLIQMEVLLLYLTNFIFKLRCVEWQDGSALGKVLCNTDFSREGLPSWLMRPLISRCLTYGALAFEALAGFGLCIAATRAVSFWAALAFHGLIAMLIDVHLFSAITAAALMTFAPIAAPSGAVAWGSVPAGVDLVRIAVVALYASYVVWGYWPHAAQDKQRRGAAHTVLLPLRRWALFAPPGDRQLEWEIVSVTASGGVHSYHWSATRGLHEAIGRRGTNHRARCFDLALSRNAELRAAFVAGVRRALREKHTDLRALAVNALIWEVPPACDAEPLLKDGHRLALDVAKVGSDIDVAAALAMGQALRCNAAFLALLELLLRRAGDGEHSAEALSEVHQLLIDANVSPRQGSMSSEGRRGLNALIDKLVPEKRPDVLAQMARLFAP